MRGSYQNILIDQQGAKDFSAIIVGIHFESELAQVNADLDELAALLRTLKIPTVGKIIQKRQKLTAGHLIGTGKVEETRDLAHQKGAKLVVIDHTLTGLQVRNLEERIGCQVIDRSAVILDIFTKNAKTNQAKTQVEIAKLEYLLPRLSGAWTHFGRQTGGGVRARGMGEQQIEVDRRRARERISRLKKRLEQIRKEKTVQRKARINELKVSLIGYTNSGKTTLMHAMTKASMMGRDDLFATLDASVRVIDPETRPKILLSDTVGFIRKLPHSLFDSFRSTLEEVNNANLLLHVVDISSPQREAQMQMTEEVLAEIGASEIPTITVFNKIDQSDDWLLARVLKKKYPRSLMVSAFQEHDIYELRKYVFSFFETQFIEAQLKVPMTNSSVLSLIHQSCVINKTDYSEQGEGIYYVRAPESVLKRLEKYLIEDMGAIEKWS